MGMDSPYFEQTTQIHWSATTMQFDQNPRWVSINNLRAMCERVSGCVCHQFKVEKITPRFIYVSYSNENEYATPNPMIAVFPRLDFHKGEIGAVLEYHNIINDSWDGEGWQAFEAIRDCPKLWRNLEDGIWRTEKEIEARRQTLLTSAESMDKLRGTEQ
jgi:hypothetical protein